MYKSYNQTAQLTDYRQQFSNKQHVTSNHICQQSWLHFCFFLTIHTQHLGLDWDLDSSRRLSYPGCSLSQFLFLSHPKASWPGWGTGLLISNNWKYSTHSPLGNHNSFESHAITVTAPIKLQIVVIYRPPGQILAAFLEELDGLLSSFMEDGTPLLVFGDFNIHLDRPYATDFHSLLASFDLKRLTTTSTHKSGNQLDLIYTCNCTTDNILVQPLHISDHFFITFTLHLLPGCHHLPYRLLSDVTYAPFPLPFFPL